MSEEIKNFVKERNAALLDPSKLDAFCRKWKIPISSDPEARLRALHKARAGATGLPIHLRRESKRILDERNSKSFDGDL